MSSPRHPPAACDGSLGVPTTASPPGPESLGYLRNQGWVRVPGPKGRVQRESHNPEAASLFLSPYSENILQPTTDTQKPKGPCI